MQTLTGTTGQINGHDLRNKRRTNNKWEEAANNDKQIEKERVWKKQKKHKIKVSTWNVRTMLELGKMLEIASELQRYKIDIAALQEIRWEGQGRLDKKGFTMLYSGGKRQGQQGVAFVVLGEMREKILEFRAVNERIAYLRIETDPFKLSLLNVYAHTENTDDEIKDGLYEMIQEELEKIPSEDIIVMVGDFNAQIGKEDFIAQVAGKHTIHEKTNNNGQRLCRLATEANMIISSTMFPHPKRHKVTWIAPDNKTQTQIDHVLVTRRRQSSIQDVRT